MKCIGIHADHLIVCQSDTVCQTTDYYYDTNYFIAYHFEHWVCENSGISNKTVLWNFEILLNDS